MVYIMYMYVNKRVELAQRGIALYKMYVLLLLQQCAEYSDVIMETRKENETVPHKNA